MMDGLKLSLAKKLEAFSLEMDLEWKEGILGIFGASGSGKTMLLKMIAGIETPDTGNIYLYDHCLFDSSRKISVKTARRKVGLLFQSYALFSNMTLIDNVRQGARGDHRRVEQFMKLFRIWELRHAYPGQISGGQRQRGALARMMASPAELYLLDEPFSSLDRHLVSEIEEELLEALTIVNKPIIYVSHHMEEIYRYCHSMVVVDQGKIIERGKVEEVGRQPRKLQTAKLLRVINILEDDYSRAEERNKGKEKNHQKEKSIEKEKNGIKKINRDRKKSWTGIYPHHIRVTADGDYVGKIKKISPTGTLTRWEVELNNGQILYVDTFHSATVGETVRLELPEDKVLILEE